MKILPNSILFFRYSNPIGLGILISFDKAPLLVPFGVSKGYLIGVNLHWVPRDQRKKFFKFVYLRYKKHTSTLTSKSALEKFPMILYNEMKSLKSFKHGLEAIRKYIVSRITKLSVIPETEYPNIFTTPYRARIVYKSKGYIDSKSSKSKTSPKSIITKSTKSVTKKQIRK
jgi:hypothetical protein